MRPIPFFSLLSLSLLGSTASAQSLAPLETLPVGNNAYDLEIDGAGGTVGVTSTNPGTLTLLSTASRAIVGTVPLPVTPNSGLGLSVDGSGTLALVNSYSNASLVSVDLQSQSVLGSALVGISGSGGLAVVPQAPALGLIAHEGGACAPAHCVSVVRDDSGGTWSATTVLANLPVGIGPRGVEISPDGTTAFVPDGNSATVSVLQTPDPSAWDTQAAPILELPVGTQPTFARLLGDTLFVGDATVTSEGFVHVVKPSVPGDWTTATVVGSIGGFAQTTYDLAPHPDGVHAVVVDGQGVHLLEAASPQQWASANIADSIGLSGTTHRVRLTPDGSLAAVSRFHGGSVTFIEVDVPTPPDTFVESTIEADLGDVIDESAGYSFRPSVITSRTDALVADFSDEGCTVIDRWAGSWRRATGLSGATESGLDITGPSLLDGDVGGTSFSASLRTGGQVGGQVADGTELRGYFARISSRKAIWYGVQADCPVPDADDDGFTIEEGDCDDEDPSRSPGLMDICGDGIDNDCHPGTADDRCGTVHLDDLTTARVVGQNGNSELFFSAILSDGAAPHLFVSSRIDGDVFGPWIPSPGEERVADASWRILDGGLNFANGLRAVDVDQDGEDELLVQSNYSVGRADLYDDVFSSPTQLACFEGPSIPSWSDALPDGTLLLGAHTQDEAYVVAPADLPALPTCWDSTAVTPDFLGSGGNLGIDIAYLGDVDGDGSADIGVVDASLGRVLIELAGGSYEITAPGMVTVGVEGVGDVDGDGFDDLVTSDADGPVVVFGRAAWTNIDTSTDSRVLELNPSTAFPTRPASVSSGDHDGDGVLDLFFGDYTFPDHNDLWVVQGPLRPGSYDLESVARLVDGESGNGLTDGFGITVDSADLDADGCDEIVVGAPWWPGNGTSQGGTGQIAVIFSDCP